MARKTNEAQMEMLRANYMTPKAEETTDDTVAPVETVSNNTDESTVVDESVIAEPLKKTNKNDPQLYITTVRLPQDIKRAMDLYRIDERPRSGLITISQVISDALKAYIPEKYFD